jgi:hypothetical protein
MVKELDSPEVIKGKRTRGSASNDLAGFHAAFSIGLDRPIVAPTRLHSKDLPPPPKFWKQLKNHPHSEGFANATLKEYETL